MLGSHIRAARERAGIKQAALARKLGISQLRMWRYEDGRAQPGIDMLARIASELGTTTDALIHGAKARRRTAAGGA